MNFGGFVLPYLEKLKRRSAGMPDMGDVDYGSSVGRGGGRSPSYFDTAKYGMGDDNNALAYDKRLRDQYNAAEESLPQILKSMGRSLFYGQPKQEYPGPRSRVGANEDYRMNMFSPGDASGSGQAAQADRERQRIERLRRMGLF